MRLRLLGLVAAVFAFAVDQASKQWLLFDYDIASRQPVRLAPFLEIILRWNKGISYSFFTSDTDRGRYILLGVTLLAVVFLLWWLWRIRSGFSALALGLLIGGALGNVYDRIAYGAVADFVHFSIGNFSWYVFNGADVAITLGVIILIYESFLVPKALPATKMP